MFYGTGPKLENLARDKWSSLFSLFNCDGRKKNITLTIGIWEEASPVKIVPESLE
jgi:hypothetical protein